jgi:type II secretory ATPase GspE/PulE/Tfp pilus assembly ATPase PilB-like protein
VSSLFSFFNFILFYFTSLSSSFRWNNNIDKKFFLLFPQHNTHTTTHTQHNTTQHNTHSGMKKKKPKRNKYSSKKKKLEAYEQIKQQKKALELKTETDGENEKQKKDKKSESFFSKLTQTIINNLQVIVRNVHARYEDYTTDPKVCFLEFGFLA